MRNLVFFLFVSSLAACSTLPATSGGDLDAIVADFEALNVMAGDPDSVAEHEISPTWTDISREHDLETQHQLELILARLDAIDASGLSEDERLNLAILKTIVSDGLVYTRFDEARIPFTGDWGFQAEVVFDISQTRLKSAADAEALIVRMEKAPAYLEAHVANMRRGLETGFVSYQDPLDTVMEQIRDQLSRRGEASDLYAPFKSLPASIGAEDQNAIQADAVEAVNGILDEFAVVLAFLENEYSTKTRPDAGVLNIPEGREYYKAVLGLHTTRADLTPEEVHEIGQSEVARIRAEMEEIIAEVGFDGSFADFLTFLRTDPQFYAKTPEELMARAARLSKDIDLKMPEFFGTLPRLSYGVEPVPAAIAPGYTTGRYVSGDPENGRAGIYWVNTYALDQRPFYELPALTAHEAVPGHHHQIALSQELEDVPGFRRSYYATSFGEGWGLYAESLATEMWLYKTPYERFGKLSYEMWRACRLVADTGMHWYGWTRAEGEKCFIENSALAPLNIKTEVTRYIGWPGQATAYKMGELTIKALRAEAEEALGEAFDLREFHDVVLEKGALPLDLLEARVRAWVDEKRAE